MGYENLLDEVVQQLLDAMVSEHLLVTTNHLFR